MPRELMLGPGCPAGELSHSSSAICESADVGLQIRKDVKPKGDVSLFGANK